MSAAKDLSEGFHPHMLIEAAREQAPEYAWLPEGLASCAGGEWESRAYIHYVSSRNPNKPGAEWQFETNVVLHHESLGMVVLDILKGERLGGVELVDRLD